MGVKEEMLSDVIRAKGAPEVDHTVLCPAQGSCSTGVLRPFLSLATVGSRASGLCHLGAWPSMRSLLARRGQSTLAPSEACNDGPVSGGHTCKLQPYGSGEGMATLAPEVGGTRSGLARDWKGGRVWTEALARKGVHNVCESGVGG